MAIKNDPTIKEKHVDDIRAAIGHRATWFYMLLDEARKRGLDWDDFARAAVYRTGCLHGESRFTKTANLDHFAKEFANQLSRKLFEMDVVEATEDKLVVDFHYCPLVAAWKKLTDDEKEIDHLCDIAMDGDRGIVSQFPDFEFDIQERIAAGDNVCRLVFTRKR